jgi:hypothetical protein
MTITEARKADLPALTATVLGWLNGPADPAIAAQVAGWDEVDWEAARWVVQVHGVAPLLGRTSAGWADWGVLSPRLREYVATQHDRSAARVGLLLGDLAEVLAAFDSAGIESMPLKGALLAARYYPAPGLRPMNDLDLLVRPHDEARALAALEGLGYRPIGQSGAAGSICSWRGPRRGGRWWPATASTPITRAASTCTCAWPSSSGAFTTI